MPTRSLPFSSPGRSIVLSFLVVIMIGTMLLALPHAQITPVSWLNCLFTATSATCVTGLLTVSLANFTIFGHLIILALMQIGGLGIITFSVFFVSLFADVGLATQQLAEQALELSTWKDTRRLLRFTIILTLVMELVGTLCIYYLLPIKGAYALFIALFHTVSSFCNVGINIFSPEALIHHEVLPFAPDTPFLIITALLIIVGGLGFITWYEIMGYIRSFTSKRRFKFSLHSKLTFIVSFWVIVSTSLILFFLEESTFAQLTLKEQIVNVLFNAISYRSTGFTTLNILTMSPAMIFWIMVISFIGSSPGSAGSGIKTTTFAIFFASVRSVIIGRTVVETKGRRIPNDQVFKAMAVLSLALSWVAFVVFVLLVTQPHISFLDITFEAFSSFANLGLSRGITPYLSIAGKGLLITSMIIGRIGAITLLLAIKRRREKVEFTYPEERVIIG